MGRAAGMSLGPHRTELIAGPQTHDLKHFEPATSPPGTIVFDIRQRVPSRGTRERTGKGLCVWPRPERRTDRRRAIRRACPQRRESVSIFDPNAERRDIEQLPKAST